LAIESARLLATASVSVLEKMCCRRRRHLSTSQRRH
jgi:hypothetical protein